MLNKWNLNNIKIFLHSLFSEYELNIINMDIHGSAMRESKE